MIIILVLAVIVFALWLAGKLVKGTVREVKSVGRTATYFKNVRPAQPTSSTFMATDDQVKNFYGYEH